MIICKYFLYSVLPLQNEEMEIKIRNNVKDFIVFASWLNAMSNIIYILSSLETCFNVKQ